MAPSLITLPLPMLLILCATLLHPAVASGDDLLMLDRFHRWMGEHGRSYPSAAEKLRRLEIYRHNVELIEATNKESWRLGYELGENQFTDLTSEEFAARYTGGALVPEEDDPPISDGIITTLAGDVNEGTSTFDLNPSSSVPRSFDWRDQGVITAPKSQGECVVGPLLPCMALVESLYKIKGGELLDLSEQELLDCDVADQKGCKGGWLDRALRWIKTKGGAMTEADYPYQGVQGQCNTTTGARRVGNITDVKRVRGESQLKLAVLQRPVGVLIDANNFNFKSYMNGIYSGPCTTRTNHAVVLIGYGVGRYGQEYWILKNSWGQGWGQKGFFFMRRYNTEEGLCGVALWGTYPVM